MSSSEGGARRAIARFLRKKGLRGASTPPLDATCVAPAAMLREYAVPLARQAAPFHLTMRLSIPDFPPGLAGATFGEHVMDGADPTRTVIALTQSAAAQSEDLGETWSTHAIKLDGAPRAAFTTSQGTRLVCTHYLPRNRPSDPGAWVYRFDADWRQTGAPLAVGAPWHGSASIGEADGVIMFAEYPDNGAKYREGDTAEVLPSQVWRSRDDGLTWEIVKTVSSDAIRHLHTLAPEREVPHRWWLSSGDRRDEVFVWRSDDDGQSWVDVTEAAPDVTLHPHYRPYARAVQRMTDLVFQDGQMIWGADDWLGYSVANADDRPASGSRLFQARTDGDWKVTELGHCGKPVRSIVDVGPAYLITTEAKHIALGGRPDVCLLFKDDLHKVHHIAQIDQYNTKGSGFTYSRASRVARDGVFFSYRGPTDAFPSGPRLMRWELKFT